jgi:hypothetical protein
VQKFGDDKFDKIGLCVGFPPGLISNPNFLTSDPISKDKKKLDPK